MAAVVPTPKPFKEQHSFEKRVAEAKRIKERYPTRVPIIVQRAHKSNVPMIDKVKFLCPLDLVMSSFTYVIRRRIKLPADEAIFLFVNNTLPPAAALLSQIYQQHADPDGFLYITYSGESTFGSV
jgi:GABA(A) receptor-associated protein